MSSVFLVEDNPLVQRYLVDLLEQVGGFRTACFEGGDELLEAVEQDSPDLVLLDLNLPGWKLNGEAVDGIDLCRALKQRSGKGPVVALLSAHVLDEEEDRWLRESGADLCFAKPIVDPHQFLQRLKNAL